MLCSKNSKLQKVALKKKQIDFSSVFFTSQKSFRENILFEIEPLIHTTATPRCIDYEGKLFENFFFLAKLLHHLRPFYTGAARKVFLVCYRTV